MNFHGDETVDFRTGDLLQNGRAVVRRGLQKSREAALGEQHGSGKAVKIHSGCFFYKLRNLGNAGLQDNPGSGIDYFVSGRLQIAR